MPDTIRQKVYSVAELLSDIYFSIRRKNLVIDGLSEI